MSHNDQYELSKAHIREVRLVVIIIDLASDSRLPTSAEARKSLAFSNIEPEHEGISWASATCVHNRSGAMESGVIRVCE